MNVQNLKDGKIHPYEKFSPEMVYALLSLMKNLKRYKDKKNPEIHEI